MFRIFFASTFSLLSLTWAAHDSYAAESVSITSILARPAKFYEASNTKSAVQAEIAASRQFTPPLEVLELKDGFVRVEIDGKAGWLLLRNVSSNRQLRMTETCGAMPTDSIPKMAATRGVGEGCKK